MNQLQTEAEAFAREYRQLVGMVVTDIVVTPESDFVGLKLKGRSGPLASTKVAWVQCDPEGNGHGFLAIEEV